MVDFSPDAIKANEAAAHRTAGIEITTQVEQAQSATAADVYQLTDEDLAKMNAPQNSFEGCADPFESSPSLEGSSNGEKPIEGDFLGISVHDMCQWRYELKNSEHGLSPLSFWSKFCDQNPTLKQLIAEGNTAKKAGDKEKWETLKQEYLQYRSKFEEFHLEKIKEELKQRHDPTEAYLRAYFAKYATYDDMKNVRSIAKYYNDNGFSFSSKKAYLFAEEFFNDTETKKYGDEYDQREFGGGNGFAKIRVFC
ncbi:MAG: hypothetical protein K9M51_02200 [Candidatus Gracilibacteria bacterium]|nr:hypothetical protein [Candidatus Gracilibacteria bacterium]